MKYIPKRGFLVRQTEKEGGKKEDVVAKRGIAIELTDREAIKFWGALKLEERDQKRLLAITKVPNNNYRRLV